MNKYELMYIASYIPIVTRVFTGPFGLSLCWLIFLWHEWLVISRREWNGFKREVWVDLQHRCELAMIATLFLARFLPSILLPVCLVGGTFLGKHIPRKLLHNPLVWNGFGVLLLSSDLFQVVCVVGMIIMSHYKMPTCVDDKDVYGYISARFAQVFALAATDLSTLNRFFLFLSSTLWQAGLTQLETGDGVWDVEPEIRIDLSRREAYRAHQF